MSSESSPTGRHGPGSHKIKALARSALGSPDFEKALDGLNIPPEKLINPLLSFLCATDEMLRWRAIRAIGRVVSGMAQNSIESARTIMRRLIWSLNDESGGIGWGAPEAMGEIMAEDGTLACEFYCILISYIDEAGNPLENDLLERGALWGIGRLAQVRPELVACSAHVLRRLLHSPDPVKRGLAIWILGFLGPGSGTDARELAPLLRDESEIRIYEDGEIRTYRTRDLASALPAGANTG